MRSMSVAVLSTSVLLAASTAAWSLTIHVPGDYPTIQAGIDAAVPGDVVVVVVSGAPAARHVAEITSLRVPVLPEAVLTVPSRVTSLRFERAPSMA